MIINTDDITPPDNQQDTVDYSHVRRLESTCLSPDMIYSVLSRPDHLGFLTQNRDIHFYSDGAFNLIQLLLYILKQTGPADIILSTYSIAESTLYTLKKKIEQGDILSIKFLIDNRVRSISPKPFNYLVTSFPDSYRCTSLHAKVAVIWNDKWHISIVGSQNATHNPKLERGIIHTDFQIWKFDKKMLDDQFERGSD